MAADPRVLGLLQEMLDAGKTPDEVCRGCPELLAEVRERWKELRIIDAAVVELLPGLRTAPDVGAVTPVPPAAGLPQVPGYELFGEVGRGGMGPPGVAGRRSASRALSSPTALARISSDRSFLVLNMATGS